MSLFSILLSAGAARAQETAQEMSIIVPAVEARSGPSEKFYATSKLHQGDKILVLKGREDNPGWLAIKPPPGSFSWINARFVKVDPIPPKKGDKYRYGRVIADDESPGEVRVGSELDNRRPDRVQVHLKRGTQVIVLDPHGQADEDGLWYPIQAPPEEVRYIPASAVGPVIAKVGPQPEAPGKGTSPYVPTEKERQLCQEAEQRQKEGKFSDAKQKYLEAAQETKDHTKWMYYRNKIEHLNTAASSSKGTTGGTSVALTSRVSPAGKTTTQYVAPVPNPARWVGPGWLQRSTIQIDGRTVYALVDQKGSVLLHVIPQTGGNLEPYVGKTPVQVYGPVQFQGDGAVRSELMTATYLNPLR
jgi:hypothetical protein